MGTWSDGAKDTDIESPCTICHGARFVHPPLLSGKPDFSRVVACDCILDEKDENRRTKLEQYSNLGALKRLTFENLVPQGRSGHQSNQQLFQMAYDAAKAFSEKPKGWLIFLGPSGCGKTHLAAAIVNERIKHDQPALYKTTPDLLDDLRSAFNPEREIPYDQSFDVLRNTPLLVIDDLGTQSSTPWSKEKLDQLLNHRYSQQLPTIITTNVPVEQLDDRISNRLSDNSLSRVFLLEGRRTNSPDYDWTPGLELQRHMTFKNFDWHRINLPPKQRESLEFVYRQALDYAKSPESWIIFQGVTGCGKTHLAAAIVNYRYQAGNPALFIVVPEFLDHLRSTFSPESKVSYDELFESVKKTPLLILDDFGEQATTRWAQEKLYQVINYRYNAQLPTVITTRHSLDDIDSRISSRFVDRKLSMTYNIDVPDYRGDMNTKKGSRASMRTEKNYRHK
ncbi:MAG: ATP-binding protein [Dehalococcoidia bacterium]|nr:MAG: ATP-binding protein [Dehalococcoidia bacterium]